jgi:hypothetical protein
VGGVTIVVVGVTIVVVGVTIVVVGVTIVVGKETETPPSLSFFSLNRLFADLLNISLKSGSFELIKYVIKHIILIEHPNKILIQFFI